MAAPPKRYWFKAKNYGWGWTPCTAEGWGVVIGGLAAFTLFFVLTLLADSLPLAVIFGVLSAASLGVMIVVSAKRGERPRWRWGGD